MKLVFYGTRGSYPTSTPPSRIEEIAKRVFTLSKKNPRLDWIRFKKLLGKSKYSDVSSFSQHTTCIELRSDMAPYPIFLDMGTGLSAAAVDTKSGLNNTDFRKDRGEVAIFLSHTHWDHVIALPTLQHIYKGDNKFHFYGGHPNLERRISKLFDRDFFPVPYTAVSSRFRFHAIKRNVTFSLGQLKVASAPQSHPGTSYAYRFDEGGKSFVFASDTDLANTFRSNYSKSFNIYTASDLLALDTHYTHEDYVASQDYGHPSIEMAIDFSVQNKVGHLVMIHHNPLYNDKELDHLLIRAQKYLAKKHGERHPLKMSLPYEGKVYNL